MPFNTCFFTIVLIGTIMIILLILILHKNPEIFYLALKAVVNSSDFFHHNALKITRSRSDSCIMFVF
jgi:hypothetical protein